MTLAFKDKEPHYLTNNEIQELNRANENFRSVSDEELALLDNLDWTAPVAKWSKRTPTIISHEIGLHGSRLRLIGRAINAIAKRDSRIKTPTSHRGGREYLLPPPLDGIGSIF